MAEHFDFRANKKGFDHAANLCLEAEKRCETAQKQGESTCIGEFADCVESASEHNEGTFIECLINIDVYSAITWQGETAKRIDPKKIDDKITLSDLKAIDFDGDQKFTTKDANTLMTRLQTAKLTLRSRALDGVTSILDPLSDKFVATFKDYLKNKAPDLYKKAFSKDE